MPDNQQRAFKVNVSFSIFKSKVRNFYLEKILGNTDAGRHSDRIIFSEIRAAAVFQA